MTNKSWWQVDRPKETGRCDGCGAVLPDVTTEVVKCSHCGREWQNDPKKHANPRAMML